MSSTSRIQTVIDAFAAETGQPTFDVAAPANRVQEYLVSLAGEVVMAHGRVREANQTLARITTRVADQLEALWPKLNHAGEVQRHGAELDVLICALVKARGALAEAMYALGTLGQPVG